MNADYTCFILKNTVCTPVPLVCVVMAAITDDMRDKSPNSLSTGFGTSRTSMGVAKIIFFQSFFRHAEYFHYLKHPDPVRTGWKEWSRFD